MHGRPEDNTKVKSNIYLFIYFYLFISCLFDNNVMFTMFVCQCLHQQPRQIPCDVTNFCNKLLSDYDKLIMLTNRWTQMFCQPQLY